MRGVRAAMEEHERMTHDHAAAGHTTGAPEPPTTGVRTPPRLSLPRFELAPASTFAQRPTLRRDHPAPAPPSAPAPVLHDAAPWTPPHPAPTSTPAPAPVHVQQVHRVAHQSTVAPAAHDVRATYHRAPPVTTVRYAPPTPAPAEPEPTLLQRLTPTHMGLLLVGALLVCIAGASPGTGSAPSLSRTVTGGGVGDATGATTQATTPPPTMATGVSPEQDLAAAALRARADAQVAVDSAAVASAPAPRRATRANAAAAPTTAPAGKRPSARRIAGRSTLPMRDGVMQFPWMPTAAAARQLGPDPLPYREDDGVSLPNGPGERDSHAVDAHYGIHATLGYSEPIELPALTPAEAAARAEHYAIRSTMSPEYTAPTVSGLVAD